ncbi:MAG: Gfo/Idh/MocA family oxidoreductase [Chloroflexi bacterium]|nr:Gfo/Idh/MocA family oxidoreductase [Chloroflexota bacterium]
MYTLKIGVIGAGYWGPNLLRNFVEIPDADAIAVADLDEERLRFVKKRYPSLMVTQDYHDLFELGLDAVAIATPPSTHYAIARDCLEHGLHVLVEKPITLSSHDAEMLVELADQRNLTLMVGHTFAYNPAVRALKEIIDSGELGQVYYVDTVRVNLGLFQNQLNVLWDLAPHDISILRFILGAEPIAVGACGAACICSDIHDVAYLYLEFPDQVVAHSHISWLDPAKVRRITVVGSKKMLVYDDIEPLEKIRIYDKGIERLPHTDTFGDFQLNYRYGDIVIPNIRFTEPLRIECQDFIDSVVNHTPPVSDGNDGLQVVKILELADCSLQQGNGRLHLPEREVHGRDALHAN